MEYSFASDYQEGCHPSILQALEHSNLEQTPGYGVDEHCQRAADAIRRAFACPEAEVFFLVGGTQTNTAVISALLRPWEGVLSAETGHINVHETGAIESCGHKVLALPGREGRLSGAQVAEAVALQADFEHTVKPGMVYISQSTELGTVYDKAQLTELYQSCRALGLPLYIDGARLAAALASPACDLEAADIPRVCDVFTVGGTKNGALFGEAVVFVNPALAKDFRYVIKQRGAMLAKGRLLGIQYEALMEDGLYFRLGRHAVDQAMKLRAALQAKGIRLLVDSPTNQQFPVLPDAQLEKLAERFGFEAWERVDAQHSAVRFCTSWATSDAAVSALIGAIEQL